MNRPSPITAAMVRAMYADASPSARLSPPSIEDCEGLALFLTVNRDADAARKAVLARPSGATGERDRRRREAIRKAIGVLTTELPGFIATIPVGALPPGGEHAGSLAGLLDAATRASDWWPGLDGRMKRFDPRIRWAITADTIAGLLLAAWRRANPGCLIGKPTNADQDSTRLMVAALAAMGHAVTVDQVAKHFARDGSAFFIIDAAANLPTK